MVVRRVPVSSLKLDPQNARKHGDKNLGAIGESLRAFGQVEPLVVQKGTGKVIGGNGRLEVMRAAGETECDIVEVDVSDDRATALGIALNRTGELATWDDGTLARLLQELPADLQAIAGFDEDDLSELITRLTPKTVDEDEVPEPLPEPVSRRGDVWVLGGHRLMCGDSTDGGEVALCVQGDAADTVTDPPYGIGYEYASHDDDKNENPKLWDKVRVHAPGACIWTPGLMNLARELIKNPTAKVLVWHKGFAQAGNGLGGASTWEPVLCVGVTSGRLPNDYLHFGTDREEGLRDKHPCPKPVKLYAHLIEYLTGRGVYEPFSGSGTTIIACEQLGRRCFAIEIEPRYVDVAVRRWQKLTGKSATLESSGATWADTAAERGVAVA